MKYGTRGGEENARNIERRDHAGRDSLHELIKNTKLSHQLNYEGASDEGFIGEGISPDKKRRHQSSKRPGYEEDFETQQNKEKTRKILQNFDFNKLFYPSHTSYQKRNATSLNDSRRRARNNYERVEADGRPATRGGNLPSQPPMHGHGDLDDLRMGGQPNLVDLSKTAA